MPICARSLAGGPGLLASWLLALGMLALGMWPLAAPAQDAPTLITSRADLLLALAHPAPGAVLSLGPGDYGDLVLQDFGGTPGAPVTLRAADPAQPARFSGLDLRQAHHLVLDGLSFDYRFVAGDKPYKRPFALDDGTDVTIRHSHFVGDMAKGVSAKDDGYPTGFGLSFTRMAGVMLADSDIGSFYRGLVVSESSDVQIAGNDLHDLRMDGMDLAQVIRVTIAGNHIHDFIRVVDSPDHPDMIQFWTKGTKQPSHDIIIRDNILNSGKGWYTQSIFMRNEEVDQARAGPEMFYRNITIEQNVIFNAQLHGITVGETAGLVIRNNSVIRNAASQGLANNPDLWTPQIRVAPKSTEVTIARNVTSKISGYSGQTDWTLADNFLIQDRSAARPGYYAQVFTAAGTGDLASFVYRTGGPLDGTGLGATILNHGKGLPAPGH